MMAISNKHLMRTAEIRVSGRRSKLHKPSVHEWTKRTSQP